MVFGVMQNPQNFLTASDQLRAMPCSILCRAQRQETAQLSVIFQILKVAERRSQQHHRDKLLHLPMKAGTTHDQRNSPMAFLAIRK